MNVIVCITTLTNCTHSNSVELCKKVTWKERIPMAVCDHSQAKEALALISDELETVSQSEVSTITFCLTCHFELTLLSRIDCGGLQRREKVETAG